MKLEQDRIVVIETNVDDVTGEIVSRTIERVLSDGAEDAYASTYLGKKDRPGYTIKVVCTKRIARRLSETMMEETGTLGVKMMEYTRLAAPRKIIMIPIVIGRYVGKVPVKVSETNGKFFRIKPEFENACQIAKDERVPLRDVLEGIQIAARNFISNMAKPRRRSRIRSRKMRGRR